MVISYLSFKQIINCLRVSKGWKAFLTQNPRVWTTLDLSEARRDVSRASVRNVVRYAKGNVQRALIHRFRHSDMIENLASACKGLLEFELLSGGRMDKTLLRFAQSAQKLKKLVVSTISVATMHQILSHLPTLEYAAFSNITDDALGAFPRLPLLKTLMLSGRTTRVSNAPLQTPVLESLTLNDIILPPGDLSAFPLKHLEISGIYLGASGDFWLPQTLESVSLRLPGAEILHFMLAPGAGRLRLRGLPLLKFLSATLVDEISPAYWNQLLDGEQSDSNNPTPEVPSVSGKPYLQHVAIKECAAGDPLELLKSNPRSLSPYLQTMAINRSPTLDDSKFDDDFIDRIKGHDGKSALHTIDLSRTFITGAGVKFLVDNVPSLRTLNIEQCSRITSRDIVAYAQNKGINVLMGSQVGSQDRKRKRGPASEGRRVRYE